MQTKSPRALVQEEKGRVEPGSTEEPDMQIVVLAASHNCVRLPPRRHASQA